MKKEPKEAFKKAFFIWIQTEFPHAQRKNNHINNAA
jgi:hypothetical protein